MGFCLTGLALGVFSSVDQALVLNVLPEKDTDAGRFLGINGYSTSIAQAVAPLVAAPLILIGVSGNEKNYGLLFLIAAALTIVAGDHRAVEGPRRPLMHEHSRIFGAEPMTTTFHRRWTFHRGTSARHAVRLPHDAMIGEPRSADAGHRRPRGLLRRRRVRLPQAVDGTGGRRRTAPTG